METKDKSIEYKSESTLIQNGYCVAFNMICEIRGECDYCKLLKDYMNADCSWSKKEV